MEGRSFILLFGYNITTFYSKNNVYCTKGRVNEQVQHKTKLQQKSKELVLWRRKV